jgi:O-antigen/teichoic acid export membrane protein
MDVFGGYRFRFKNVTVSKIRELLSFGFRSFVMGVASMINNTSSSLIIGIFLGPAMVVFYTIPANLIQYLLKLFQSATMAFMPFFSDLHARDSYDSLRTAFVASSRYMVGLVVLGYISAGFLGPAFISIWMGPEYESAGKIIIYLLVISFGYRMLLPFQGRLMTGIGRHGVLAKISSVEAVFNLCLSLVLVNMLGIAGVAVSALITHLLFGTVVMRVVCRQVSRNIYWYLKKVIFPTLPSAAALAAFYSAVVYEWPLDSYLSLFAVATTGCLLYFAVFLMTAIDLQERRSGFETVLVNTRGAVNRIRKLVA